MEPLAFSVRALTDPAALARAAAVDLSRVGTGAVGYCIVLLPGDEPVFAIARGGGPVCHLASRADLVRSRYVDPGRVPVAQRDRWVEPVRERFVSSRAARRVPVAPLLEGLAVRDLCRQHVCIGPRLVGGLGHCASTRHPRSPQDRARLEERAAIWRPLLRAHVLLAETERPRRGPVASALTRRQRQIVELVADGLTNEEIAARLRLSSHTVKTMLHRLYERTGSRGRMGLVRAVADAPLLAGKGSAPR